jgi:ATP-dependent DNA helicase RecG
MSSSLLDRILKAARVGENADWEFKSAKGGLPRSLWETYSAMANTAGGTIVLGASERDGTAQLDGLSVDQLNAYLKALWDNLNNRSMTSRNLLADRQVRQVKLDRGWLLAIEIPVASRTQRPVYLGPNPFGHTFRRRHEGDYRCSDEEVRRMLADADDVPADARILDGFGLDDLDESSLAQYRQRSATRPGHTWLSLDNKQLLEQLGGWRRDRESGKEGLTLAGLLMFGKHQSVISPGAAPEYFVDYRDYRDRRMPDDRWSDRLFPDGTWEANLFQFYQRGWPKLIEGLKVPFELRGAQRIDDTPVHQALREAFVNSLIHSDYSAPGGIVVERYRERYNIENPGILLVSMEQLRRGGVSECRNKALQKMLIFIGGGEQAGSGYARIQSGWKSQHWRAPLLSTQSQPDRVMLSLPMVSLLPEEALAALRAKFKDRFSGLSSQEALALATALIEGEVTNTRMQDLVVNHPAEITKLLQGLVARGFLMAEDRRRWTRYRLPGPMAEPRDLFSLESLQSGEPSSSPLAARSSPLAASSSPFAASSSPLAAKMEELRAIAAPVAGKGRASQDEMRQVICELCRHQSLTLANLADLLDRNAQGLRNKYLTPMVREGSLRLRYPAAPNHPDQAYTANSRPKLPTGN